MIAPAAASSVFRQVHGLEVLTWPAFDASGADVLVTTRHGGVSAGPYASLNLSFTVGDDPASVLENRRRALAALGAGLDDAVFAEQVHGAVAQVVGAADRGRGTRASAGAVPGADALVTADPGTVLAVLAADCVPVVLYDPVAHVLACAHAGWRGTVARTAAAAVAVMRSLGTRPADVIAGIGPAVAPDCYQIGPEVAEAAARAFGDRAPDVLRATGPGQWQFDLWMANRLVLTEAGVPGDQIQASDVPTGPIPATDPSGPISNTGFSGPITATDPSGSTGPAGGPFFSHRAERPCGRFAAMACLRARQALRPGEAR
ncbi:MAG: polyphenol oxidase family protein [Streptosporangiaceae bacterium]